MEQLRPGALRKTISEDRDRIRALFEHGQDPLVGMRPIGVPRELRDEAAGAYYEVELFDAPYVSENVLPASAAASTGRASASPSGKTRSGSTRPAPRTTPAASPKFPSV